MKFYLRCASLRLTLITLFLINISGCVSGYKEFYSPAQGVTSEEINARRLSVPPIEPLIEHIRPMRGEQIVDDYYQRGYMLIGYSEFNSGHDESDASAVEQGKTVGADLVVILSPSYTGTVTTTIPIVKPTTTTSYTQSMATVYGNNGPVTAYGLGKTTTYGTKTDYLPFSIDRADYGALYFIKFKYSLGASLRELNEGESRKLDTYKGVAIHLVVYKSPAYNADLLIGDIIRTVDNVTVNDAPHFMRLIDEKKGKEVLLEVFRKDKLIEKKVQLN